MIVPRPKVGSTKALQWEGVSCLSYTDHLVSVKLRKGAVTHLLNFGSVQYAFHAV